MNKNINPIAIGYMAGMIDGEGGIYLLKVKRNKGFTRFVPRIEIFNTNKEALTYLQKEFQCGRLYPNHRGNWLSKKPVWYLRILKLNDVYMILKTVAPYLHVKKKMADLMIRYLEIRFRHPKHVFKFKPNGVVCGSRFQELYPEEKKLVSKLRRVKP
jgi:hypothetical protein